MNLNIWSCPPVVPCSSKYNVTGSNVVTFNPDLPGVRRRVIAPTCKSLIFHPIV